MSGRNRPRVAVFRPDDDRLTAAVELLESLGVEPVADPLLEIVPTGRRPRSDADVVILTSLTGARLVAAADWRGEATICAIGETTAAALRATGYHVDVIPAEFSSAGLVDRLQGTVGGRRVEVARSDHGSEVLIDGLVEAGAYVHETVLYRLRRPTGSGEAAVLAAEGELDGALFTSSLTVEHFVDAADERGVQPAALEGLEAAVVGAIGSPTRQTASEQGIEVDVVPDRADFEALARGVVERLQPADPPG